MEHLHITRQLSIQPLTITLLIQRHPTQLLLEGQHTPAQATLHHIVRQTIQHQLTIPQPTTPQVELIPLLTTHQGQVTQHQIQHMYRQVYMPHLTTPLVEIT